MAKTGPKKKPGARYPSGDLRPEAQEKLAMEVARWQRKKLGASDENWRDQEWSSPLGQLRMRAKVANSDAEGLSQEQYLALRRYIHARHQHRIAQGYPPESPKSIAGELVGGMSGGSGFTHDDEEVFRRAREYNGAKSALLDFASQGVDFIRVCEGLATDADWTLNHVGTARQAANVLCRHWGMT